MCVFFQLDFPPIRKMSPKCQSFPLSSSKITSLKHLHPDAFLILFSLVLLSHLHLTFQSFLAGLLGSVWNSHNPSATADLCNIVATSPMWLLNTCDVAGSN